MMINLLLSLAIFGQFLDFARQLEEEGDYYRAIYEYKRIYYETFEADVKDYVASKIAYLSLRIGNDKDAYNYVLKISDQDPYKNIKLGFVYLAMRDFDKARELWKGNDTLLAWSYLKEGKLKNFSNLFPDFKIEQKSSILAGLMSAVIPGSGKIYANREFDGILSLLINLSTGYSAYRAYKRDSKVETYVYSGLTFIFYAGDIYGSIEASKEWNRFKLDQLAKEFESRYNLWKYWQY